MVRGFEPFIVIVFFIKVNEVCSCSSLAAARAISSKVTSLAAFETCIVSGSPRRSGRVILGCGTKAGGISLHTSSVALSPVWGSSAS